MNNHIYESPILEIEEELKALNEDVVFLMGGKGTGKTTIINHFLNNAQNQFIIDASIKPEEFIQVTDLELFNLYHTCLICIKIINYIEDFSYNEKVNKITIYKKIIIDLINRIKLMVMVGSFNNKNSLINPIILENPKLILIKLLDIIDFINVNKIKIIIDNFDKIGYSSKRYQKLVYELLKTKLKLITTISDYEVIRNPKRISNLGYIIDVDYSFELDSIKKILNQFLSEILNSNKSKIIIPSIEIFSDKFILNMARKTNGNLIIMKRIISRLCYHIEELDVCQYENFLNDYIDYEMKYYEITTGNISPIRKLYL